MSINNSYSIIESHTKKILKTKVSEADLVSTLDTYINEGVNASFIEETASAGAVSAGAIAINMSGDSGGSNMQTLKKFMDDFNSRVKNKFSPKTLSKRDFVLTINEEFDMQSVFSRLSSMEKSGSKKKTEGTTFGIEDDDGNIMRVTVRADQAQDFETEVAKYIADIKMNLDGLPSPKEGQELSMAELLFTLKDRFDIIDVDFPKIPKDVIYNADKASVGAPTPPPMEMGDDETPLDGENLDDLSEPLDLTDFEDEEGEMPSGDEMGDEMDLGDDESVEDFPEEIEGEGSEGSILAKVIDMLKAQAESDIEKAKADAEKARAEQARYTAQATQATVRDQEELLRYEAEMEEQKRREKEAQKMADMAKHRISKTLSTTAGLRESSTEIPSSRAMLRMKQDIINRYRTSPEDTQEEINKKRRLMNAELRVWQAKMRLSKESEQIDRQQQNKDRQQGREQDKQQPNDQQQGQQGQEQGQPNQQRGFN